MKLFRELSKVADREFIDNRKAYIIIESGTNLKECIQVAKD